LQMSQRWYPHFLIQRQLVPFFNSICANVNLSVIFQWIKCFELKEMNLDIVFMHHQISVVIRVSKLLKAWLV